MNCDACKFFDCGKRCRCACHDRRDGLYRNSTPRYGGKKGGGGGAWNKATEQGAMEGLSKLFG